MWLLSELIGALVRYYLGACALKDPRPVRRARWLNRTCRRLLRVFNIEVQVKGEIPKDGLVVCNHLGYLDIIVLGATMPSRFVSKMEVKYWPLFGLLARHAGTLFVDRARRRDAIRGSSELRTALSEGGTVVLFPEGTSSAGTSVLPFKPALLGVIPGSQHRLAAAGIRYSAPGASCAEDVCYWGEMIFLPHLLKLLGIRRIVANLGFARIEGVSADRKELARILHAEVAKLHAAQSLSS